MATTTRIRDFDEFVEVHAFLLAASGIPTHLHRRLFAKLASETFDGGEFFSVEPCEGGRQRRLLLSAESLSKESDLFLVDHAWSFRLPDALKQLREVPGLAERMAALMCVDLDKRGETEETENEELDRSERNKIAFEIVEKEMCRVKENGRDVVSWLEFEELGIDDDMLCSLDLSTKFPNLVALNLWGNKLQNADTVVQEITKCKNLKALWLNENPVLDSCSNSIAKAITESLPGLEIYNSCFTTTFGSWALSFCGGVIGPDNVDFAMGISPTLNEITTLDLSNRCIHKLPEEFFPNVLPSLSQLNIRGNPLDQMSTGDLLKLLSSFTCLKELEVDIPGPLGSSATEIVKSLPNLSMLNGVSMTVIVESGKHVVDTALEPRLPEWAPMDPLPERVVSAMWYYLMTYRLADEEKIDETPVWYVMDELGSAMRHSDNANFRVAPFLFMPEGKLNSAISYSVLWPTRAVQREEECTRDFLFGVGEDKQRSARLTAWFHTPQNYFIQEFRKCYQELESKALGLLNKDLHEDIKQVTGSILPSDGHPLRVFTDLPQVEEFLTRPEFVLTNEPKYADIIWTSLQVDAELKKALELNDNQYTNQFPFEACLVMKHHLAETIHKAQGSPEWLQPTYNLETQLSQLIGDYFVRKRDGLDNLWILKPWNMARTIDTTVTGDLSAIIRMMETGPKICQKYIERPALFGGRKFDLRYIVLVRSMRPLEIFLADVFWVRLANNQYTLEKSSFFEYETHFTVMNYIGKLNHKHTPEFVKEFEEEHQVRWKEIHGRITKMIRCIFESAAVVQPEMHNPRSRAIYGIDVMLDSLFMPKILEVTYCPDCTRACKYDTQAIFRNNAPIKGRDFFNTVFGCLFLGESNNVTPI
ncbi:Tubulin-tyrosine ligase family protein [Rhynchospora pubera]|uniref:Tubulin-tyrosine ligase family protein n=1 Tax=Rhynchospora pubera TaxID=906938 RepID=A0AAV8DIF6_9POAL|nr:Tubulin-tyrosine ligase family protein [Rhynchospora pubera]